MQYEPERTSNPDGGEFYQVYDSLISLRTFILPEDIPIYVKEHYSQFSRALHGYRGKTPYLYDVLASLPNVVLIDYRESSQDLIINSIAVVTQTGTACLEAACLEKKAILMGHTWFSGVSNVYNFLDLVSFDMFIDLPIYSRESVLASLLCWVDLYSIPCIVNPSTEKYFREKFNDVDDTVMYNDKEMAKQFVDTILSDLSTRCFK